MISLRVTGHTLVDKGRPHHINLTDGSLVPAESMSGPGRAVCTCGTFSPILPSYGKRQKWMREDHKPKVIEEASKSDQ